MVIYPSAIHVVPPFHWMTLLWWSWRLWCFSKKAWSTVEAPRNVRFCGSRQYTTLFARQYYAREDFAARILCPLCIPMTFVSRFLYNQGNQHALKVRPRRACCVCCTPGARLSYASDMLMALCSIKAPHIARFLHSSTGYKMSWTYILGHAAAIQTAISQELASYSYSRLRKQREEDGRRPKRFWVRAWLTDERRLQLGHYVQLKLN